jgi:hypothetical protein
MNREFRKLVKRSCPKGTLSPLASVLKNLQAKLPVLDKDHLIPSALHALKQRFDPATLSAENLSLNIKVKRHDKFAALFVDLEGTLDRMNAQELDQADQRGGREGQDGHHRQFRTPQACSAGCAQGRSSIRRPSKPPCRT